ncbi:hypothetical protein H072_1341 [Dactylellina haptotyla CBS 200.50]|uniref:Ribosome recycling factor domain-containing protein n=1 Tax=Dactylellina haptotyla (strain CBS 200.50) TaxID=1284197 RepID=S8AP64_DACHA|nr:hypothetical protein H072_1341 [Dactylellina haptotyla CBS 200.50]
MSFSRPLTAKQVSLSLQRSLAGRHIRQLSSNCKLPQILSTTSHLFKKASKGPTKLKDGAPEQYSRKGKPNPAQAAAAAESPNDDPYNFTKFDESVKHAVESCKAEMANLKSFSGRPDPSVVENIIVTITQGKKDEVGAKEAKLKLSELAHVAPKGREFILTVNDESFVNNIKNTLLAQMSLNPQPVSPSTPNILKIPIPMATKESRQNTATLVQKAGQKFLDRIQHIRGAHFTHLEKLRKSGAARVDDIKKAEKKLQEKLDKTNKELKALVEKTKQDVLQS